MAFMRAALSYGEGEVEEDFDDVEWQFRATNFARGAAVRWLQCLWCLYQLEPRVHCWILAGGFGGISGVH